LIRTEGSGDLRVVWIDRPEKRNALTLTMVEDLRDQLRRASADATVRGVIVAGTGPSTSAGVDLNEFASGTPETIRRLIGALAEACAAARRCPKPVAMAIHGHCLGGALELACACDVRVAAPEALLGMPEVMLGIPSVIDAALLERHVGYGRAQQLVLTGDPITAEQAHDWGMVNQLAEPAELLEACAMLLGRITRHDGDAIARQKRLFADWLNLPLDEAVERSKEVLVESFASGVAQRLAREQLGR
jgi:enoyl-CoA hydratase